ncbi:hypothetical protein WN943_009287 [Citrus x changshan-huyou]
MCSQAIYKQPLNSWIDHCEIAGQCTEGISDMKHLFHSSSEEESDEGYPGGVIPVGRGTVQLPNYRKNNCMELLLELHLRPGLTNSLAVNQAIYRFAPVGNRYS